MSQQISYQGLLAVDGYTTMDGYQFTLPAIDFATNIIGFNYNTFTGIFQLDVVAYDVLDGYGSVSNMIFGLFSSSVELPVYNLRFIDDNIPISVAIKADPEATTWDVELQQDHGNLLILITGQIGKTILWKYFLSGKLDLNYD